MRDQVCLNLICIAFSPATASRRGSIFEGANDRNN